MNTKYKIGNFVRIDFNRFIDFLYVVDKKVPPHIRILKHDDYILTDEHIIENILNDKNGVRFEFKIRLSNIGRQKIKRDSVIIRVPSKFVYDNPGHYIASLKY